MRVLFVDDEEAVLSGIRRTMHRYRDEFDAEFAVGGDAAIRRFRSEAFDVVITDLRMPGVDGAKVLATLQSDHPEVVRIVLSGEAEVGTAMRTIPLAHQFLTKPCDAAVLRNAIDRSTRLQASLGRTGLLPIVGGVNALPTPPAVLVLLNEMLANEDVALEEVVALIATDPAISARVLQLVNSAFFSVSRRVVEIGPAVRLLGLTTVRDLTAAAHAFTALKSPTSGFDLVQAVQGHSLAVAQLAQALTRPGPLQHEAYAGALLHDIGSLVLISRASADYRDVLARVRREGGLIEDVERDVFGASHAEIGAYFLTLWGLPYSIIEMVMGHHGERDLTFPLHPADAAFVADVLVDGREAWPEGQLSALPPDVLADPTVRSAMNAHANSAVPFEPNQPADNPRNAAVAR